MRYKARLNQPNGLKKRKLTTLILATLTSISSGAFADDTEVFFGQNTTQANVLFVIDTSGSMRRYDDPTNSNPANTNSVFPYFAGDTTRLQRLQTALTELIGTTNNINVGLASFSGANNGKGHRLLQEVRPITENRTEMLASVSALTARGSTPSVEAIFRAGQYFRGELPNDSTIELTSNGVISGTYESPMTSACQSNHIVLLTDGNPTENPATEATIANAIFGNNTDSCSPAIAGGVCGTELTKYLFDEDHSDLPEKNNIVTHTIGFNFSDPWLASLSAPEAGNGQNFNADSASDLVSAFDSILEVANDSSNTFAAPAITLDQFTRYSNRSDIYLALFQPDSTQRWAGNLKRYKFDGGVKDKNSAVALDTTTGSFLPTAQSYWSTTADGAEVTQGGAANLFDAGDASTPRKVYTYLGSDEKALAHDDNAFHEDNASITAGMLGVTDGDPRTNLMQWARGVDVDNESDGSATRLQMGDPLHSRPAILTYGGTEAVPDSVVFIGTNEGFLHAINSSDGKEVFSYIPKDLLGNLDTYYKNERSINRLYGLDGDLTIWVDDEDNNGQINGSDHAYLYMGMRRGGSQYYALDVTDKTTPKFLWSIEGGTDGTAGFENLAQSWSKPALSKVIVNGDEKDVLIFGGGYNSTLDLSTTRSPDKGFGNDLFIVDAETGDLIWNFATAAESMVDNEAMQYSVPSDLRIIDINGDQIADQIYVGDMGGQVWRFDIDNYNTDVNSLVSGGVIAELATDGSAANNRRFFYPPDVALVEDQGQRFLSISIGSGNRANPLGQSIDDRFYMIRQTSVTNAPEGYGVIVESTDSTVPEYRAIEEGDLYDATENLIQDSTVSIADSASDTLKNSEGWLLNLSSSGEKVLASSLTVSNTVLFTSYLPDTALNETCSPAIGTGRTYAVSVFDATPINGSTPEARYTELSTGGIPNEPTPFIDSNGDLTVLVNLEEVATPDFDNTTRVYWTEQPDY